MNFFFFPSKNLNEFKKESSENSIIIQETINNVNYQVANSTYPLCTTNQYNQKDDSFKSGFTTSNFQNIFSLG